jgi:hypothetical protein
MSKQLCLLLCLVAAAAFAACAPLNKIPLQYTPTGQQKAQCRTPVSVSAFEDRRGLERIGEHGPDMVLFPDTSVSQWVTWAMVEELKAAGCKAFYVEPNVPAPTDTVVTGTIQRVFIRNLSRFEYQNDMLVSVVLRRGGETVWTKEYSGSVKRTGTPTTETYRDLLQEGLQDIMARVVADLGVTI